MEPADVAEAQRVLHDLITRVDRGELDAAPLMLARLTGALEALNALSNRDGDDGPTIAVQPTTV